MIVGEILSLQEHYIAIQSCLSYTELVLQAEEQMLYWVCLTALWEILHIIYNENFLEESCRLQELLSWISNTVDSLTLDSWADLHITRHSVRTCQLDLLVNHQIQYILSSLIFELADFAESIQLYVIDFTTHKQCL